MTISKNLADAIPTKEFITSEEPRIHGIFFIKKPELADKKCNVAILTTFE